MKRILLPFVAIVALAAVACGSGDKKPAPTQAPEPAATTAAAASASPAASGSSEEAVGGIFKTLFTSGELDADAGAMPARDESLKQYVLTEDDVPAGYTSMGDFAYRLPDGISKNGGMDMAASVFFMSGDPTAIDPSGSTILTSMVLKPDDLTQLGDQLRQAQNLSEQELRDAIALGTGGLGGVKITNVQVLDAGALGDGGFGMGMTIDMSELIASIGPGGADKPSLGPMTIRMYFFGKGDYAAGIMRIGFASSLPSDVDEKALAKVVEGRLP